MLTDTNRTGNASPNALGFGKNVVGSGSDGVSYWNLFNEEGDSTISATYITYATLTDMLTDTNRTGNASPNALGFGKNVVGSGSDGVSYWNLFNEEGDSTISATYITYATLTDMLTDTNRTGNASPNALGFGKNVVGSGGWIYTTDDPISPVPLPAGLPLLLSGLGLLAAIRMSKRRQT